MSQDDQKPEDQDSPSEGKRKKRSIGERAKESLAKKEAATKSRLTKQDQISGWIREYLLEHGSKLPVQEAHASLGLNQKPDTISRSRYQTRRQTGFHIEKIDGIDHYVLDDA